MLHAIYKNLPQPHLLDTLLNGLRQIIVRRIDAHSNNKTFDFNNYYAETFDGDLLNETIASRVPQLSTPEEWIVIMPALIPHIQPSFFETIITEYLPNGGDFPEFGRVKGTNHLGMLPTGETAQFVIAGNDTER